MKNKSFKKASALVYALITLTAMMIIAVGTYQASIINQRTSTDTEKSTSSFQAADSGVELVMKIINDAIRHHPLGRNATLNQAGLCDTTPRSPEYKTEIDDRSKVKVYYYDKSGKKIEKCEAKISEIKMLKSTGSYGGTSRAVEVEVESPCPTNLYDIYDYSISYDSIRAEDGNCWLTTNLGTDKSNYGKSAACTDPNGCGWYFQWGRSSDGHQFPDSETTTTLSNNPMDKKFIKNADYPYDWRVNQEDNLWQGSGGINNPCPIDFHVPNDDEWDALITAENMVTADDAIDSDLKFLLTGVRVVKNDGTVVYDNFNVGYAWSTNPGEGHDSTYGDYKQSHMFVIEKDASKNNLGRPSGDNKWPRVFGVPVRCVMD